MLFRSLIILIFVSACNLNAAIDIIFDYSYDQTNFFTSEKRYILDQAAFAWESRINNLTYEDAFSSAIPSDYGSLQTGWVTIKNPNTGVDHQVVLGSVSQDGNTIGKSEELIIFMGSGAYGTNPYSSISDTTAQYSKSGGNDSWTSSMNQREVTPTSNSNSRDYDPIIGSISVSSDVDFYFDTDLTTHTDLSGTNAYDFYTIMTHEVGHVLGFSTESEMYGIQTRQNFRYANNVKSEYGGQLGVPWTNNSEHVGDYSTFQVLNVTCRCHPLMFHTIDKEKRRTTTDFDMAVLHDLGYSNFTKDENYDPLADIAASISDPDWSSPLGWPAGSYEIVINQTYSDWLANNPPITSGSAAPEPHYIFPLLGGLMCLLFGRKEKRLEFIHSKLNSLKTIP